MSGNDDAFFENNVGVNGFFAGRDDAIRLFRPLVKRETLDFFNRFVRVGSDDARIIVPDRHRRFIARNLVHDENRLRVGVERKQRENSLEQFRHAVTTR